MVQQRGDDQIECNDIYEDCYFAGKRKDWMQEQGVQYQKQGSISLLLAHIIVTLFCRHWPWVLVVCFSFVIHGIEWVHVLLGDLPSRALHLVDEDCDADNQKDKEKGEHPIPEKSPRKSVPLSSAE